MKMVVTLDGFEVQNIVAAHLREKFKDYPGKGECLYVTRQGELPTLLSFVVESKPAPSSAWD